MVASTVGDNAMAGMPYLWIFNWTPWQLYVELNGVDDPSNPLDPSVVKYGYYPSSDNHYQRDLGLNHGTGTVWGQVNRLVTSFEEVSDEPKYSNLADPGPISSADLYLWVFVDHIVFSQQNSLLKEVKPD